LRKISDRYGVSIHWLVSGTGPRNVDELIQNMGRRAKVAIVDGLKQAAESEAQEKSVFIPLYNGAAAAGPDGLLIPDEVADYYPFRRDWIERKFGKGRGNKDLVLVRVRGDSMAPTLGNGELVLVDLSETARTDIKPGHIYMVRLADGESLALKRIMVNRQDDKASLVCLSDNPAYEPFTIEIRTGKPLSYYILGRVRWAGKEFD